MVENSIQPRCFQFTVRRLLVATLWAAAFSGAYTVLGRIERGELDVDEYVFAPVVILWITILISLPAAAGALFGRGKRGAAIGVGAVVLFFAYIVFRMFLGR